MAGPPLCPAGRWAGSLSVPHHQENFMHPHLTVTAVARFSLLAGAALLVACASAPPLSAGISSIAAPTAPDALRPAGNERALFTWSATGSQIYECRISDKGSLTWTFVAPEADLFGPDRQKAGTHGAGPFWAAFDGSRITGTVKARADGAGPSDIPLLLLSAKSAGAAGKLAGITSVQRMNTVGGAAPASGCDAAADAGKRTKQPYTADYVFFAAP
jgi:Protein of unknown function (DUF3455)